MQFSAGQDVRLKSYRVGQKIKNYSSFKFLPENLEKFCSTELYGAPLEGSKNFLYRSSLGRKSLLISRLGGLKYPPSVHFPKAFKRPRNNAGPASIY